jgi:hypothetical protein
MESGLWWQTATVAPRLVRRVAPESRVALRFPIQFKSGDRTSLAFEKYLCLSVFISG